MKVSPNSDISENRLLLLFFFFLYIHIISVFLPANNILRVYCALTAVRAKQEVAPEEK